MSMKQHIALYNLIASGNDLGVDGEGNIVSSRSKIGIIMETHEVPTWLMFHPDNVQDVYWKGKRKEAAKFLRDLADGLDPEEEV